jgi:hypothetical protein
MSDTGGSSLSSHDHLFSAVTVWYVARPLGPATWGLVDVANMVGSECRVAGEQRKRFVAAHSIRSGEITRHGSERWTVFVAPHSPY